MARRLPVTALLLAALQPACESRRAATATAPSASLAPSSVPTRAAERLEGRAVAAGYGGVGPATPPPHPDTWIVAIVDVTAPACVSSVSVRELEMLDAGGSVVAKARAPWDVRRDRGGLSDEARRRGDYSDAGTVPFDGTLAAGQTARLRIHAAFDKRSNDLKAQPVRFRARIAAADPGVWVEGPLQGPWPTG